MSHFTVLVIGENPEKQLEPYQENTGSPMAKKYLEFVDIEDEYRKKYETGSVEKVEMPDGRLLNTFDDEFRVSGFGIGSNTHEVPKHLKVKKVKYKSLYKTFDEYMDKWCGEKRKAGHYGYWQNPNAKWDWHVLGGRWTGFFKLKKEPTRPALVAVGSVGLMTPPAKAGYVDQALKGDIDFEGMRTDKATEAARRFDKFAKLFGPVTPLRHTWAQMLKRRGKIDKKRELYHAQPQLKRIEFLRQRKDLTQDERDTLFFLDYEEYMVGREAYIAAERGYAGSTLAVLHDGRWFERGKMGWFGCVSDEKDRGQWAAEIAKLVDSLPDDTLLSVFDCHI